MTKSFTPSRIASLVAGMMLGITMPVAHAAYTVMDDDLFPTNAIPASVAAAQARQMPNQAHAPAHAYATTPAVETYSIPLRKNIWGLNDEGAQMAKELVPLMHGSKVIITGRPDAYPNQYLASQRAAYLKNWFQKNGVDASQIETRVDDSPNEDIGGMYPIEIQIISHRQSAAPIAAASRAIQRPAPAVAAPAAPPSGTTQTVAIIATPNPDARVDMVKQIALAAQAGRIDPKAAIATILELLSAAPSAQPLAQPALPATQPASEFGLVATPETARPKEWHLSAEQTLKDNIAIWAKTETYELDWRASNFFKVGRSRPLTGDLLAVIDRVTTSAGLDMGVYRKDRLIRICDKGDALCKPAAPQAAPKPQIQ